MRTMHFSNGTQSLYVISASHELFVDSWALDGSRIWASGHQQNAVARQAHIDSSRVLERACLDSMPTPGNAIQALS